MNLGHTSFPILPPLSKLLQNYVAFYPCCVLWCTCIMNGFILYNCENKYIFISIIFIIKSLNAVCIIGVLLVAHSNYADGLIYRKISNISRTKFHNSNVSHFGLPLSLRNILKPGVIEYTTRKKTIFTVITCVYKTFYGLQHQYHTKNAQNRTPPQHPDQFTLPAVAGKKRTAILFTVARARFKCVFFIVNKTCHIARRRNESVMKTVN